MSDMDPTRSHRHPARSDDAVMATPSPEAIKAAAAEYKSARDELEYFGASEDFTRNPIEAALEAAYVVDIDTFNGLMRLARVLLDRHYPKELMEAMADDPGPKLTLALRECMEAMRAMAGPGSAERTLDNAPADVRRRGGVALSLWMTGAGETDIHIVTERLDACDRYRRGLRDLKDYADTAIASSAPRWSALEVANTIRGVLRDV
jgi:hypothetical protein